MNPKIIGIYQNSYVEMLKEKRDLRNYEAWLHNQYTLMAIGNALNGKKCKYPKKPFELKDSENKLETEESYLIEMKSAIAKMNRGL